MRLKNTCQKRANVGFIKVLAILVNSRENARRENSRSRHARAGAP
jgi:hypothetical protein